MEQFCYVNENTMQPGVPFEVGAKIEIIGAASNDCSRVMIMRPGSPSMKLPTSLVQVRILDGKDKSLEGWTWAGAVNSN